MPSYLAQREQLINASVVCSEAIFSLRRVPPQTTWQVVVFLLADEGVIIGNTGTVGMSTTFP
jgi:hypothetical protein